MEAGDLPPNIASWVGSIYVYVEDVDAAYSRAIKLGAQSISPPEDKPYNERQAGFIDPGGNTWWVSTHKKGALAAHPDTGRPTVRSEWPRRQLNKLAAFHFLFPSSRLPAATI